jgi:hypothetical protein
MNLTAFITAPSARKPFTYIFLVHEMDKSMARLRSVKVGIALITKVPVLALSTTRRPLALVPE